LRRLAFGRAAGPAPLRLELDPGLPSTVLSSVGEDVRNEDRPFTHDTDVLKSQVCVRHAHNYCIERANFN